MRSTVIIDDVLFRQAKQRAAALNTSLSDIINQALRDKLATPIVKLTPFHMPVFPAEVTHPIAHEPADFAEELDLEDAAFIGRR